MKKEYRGPLIIAHRGASALAPENTLAAFRRAVADGADGIEFDVRLASDGVAVVIHDSTLKRTGQIDEKVSKLSSDELGKLDVGSWFARKENSILASDYADQRIPTLAGALDFLKDYNGLIYVELKCGDSDALALAAAVRKAICDVPVAGRIVVKSFCLSVIPYIRTHCPNVRTAALFAPRIKTILRKEKHLVKLAHEFGADEISLHFTLVTKKLMKKAAKRGLPVTIWTADSPRWVKRAFRLGLNAIITNDPGRLLEKREELLSEMQLSEITHSASI